MWATRIMFESQFHESNSFITLTYNDEHLANPPLSTTLTFNFYEAAPKTIWPASFLYVW